MSLIALALVGFGLYKAGSVMAKNPGATAGFGKFVMGLFKK